MVALGRIAHPGNPLKISATQVQVVSVPCYGKPVDDPASPYGIANEIIAVELAKAIRVQAPFYGLARDHADKIYFCTFDFNAAPDRQMPDIIPAIAMADHPLPCAGIVALDVWIGNCDRHVRNAKYTKETGPVAFDHERALLGAIPNGGMKRLTDIKDAAGCDGHCLAPLIVEAGHVAHWGERIRAVPGFFIQEVCEEAVRIAKLDMAYSTALVDFIVHRAESFYQIIENHRKTHFVKLQGMLPS